VNPLVNPMLRLIVVPEIKVEIYPYYTTPGTYTLTVGVKNRNYAGMVKTDTVDLVLVNKVGTFKAEVDFGRCFFNVSCIMRVKG
jgi:hypothetical protein